MIMGGWEKYQEYQNMTLILIGSFRVLSLSFVSGEGCLLEFATYFTSYSSLFLDSPLDPFSSKGVGLMYSILGSTLYSTSEINTFSAFLGEGIACLSWSATLEGGTMLVSSLKILLVLGRKLGCTEASLLWRLAWMDWLLSWRECCISWSSWLMPCWMDFSTLSPYLLSRLLICTSWSLVSLTGSLECLDILLNLESLSDFSLLPLRLTSSCLYIFCMTRSVRVLLTTLPLSRFDSSIRLLSTSACFFDAYTPKYGSFYDPSSSSSTESRFASIPIIIGFLLLPMCSISMLFMTIKLQMKTTTTTTIATQQNESANMNFGGTLDVQCEVQMASMMMATRSPVASSSMVENSNFLAMIFSIKSQYFESLLVTTNSISMRCWQTSQKVLNSSGSPLWGWLQTCSNLTTTQRWRQSRWTQRVGPAQPQGAMWAYLSYFSWRRQKRQSTWRSTPRSLRFWWLRKRRSVISIIIISHHRSTLARRNVRNFSVSLQPNKSTSREEKMTKHSTISFSSEGPVFCSLQSRRPRMLEQTASVMMESRRPMRQTPKRKLLRSMVFLIFLESEHFLLTSYWILQLSSHFSQTVAASTLMSSSRDLLSLVSREACRQAGWEYANFSLQLQKHWSSLAGEEGSWQKRHFMRMFFSFLMMPTVTISVSRSSVKVWSIPPCILNNIIEGSQYYVISCRGNARHTRLRTPTLPQTRTPAISSRQILNQMQPKQLSHG